MSEKIISILKEIGLAGFFDIILMASLLYAVLAWLKKRRADFVLIGILICSFIYLIAYQFHLTLTTTILQAFFAVILIALIVIFQEELRSFFERVAVFSLRGEKKQVALTHPEVEIIVKTLTELANKKIGAILVIKGKDKLDRHLEGGIELNGMLSEALLFSIFDPHSRGHDGATIVDRHQIAQFACHLPLSKNVEKLGPKGTRHGAALGLSERSDALCLVVSEESGAISAALRGEISPVRNAESLRELVERFYADITPPAHRRIWRDLIKKNFREKTIALLLSLALWFVVVHESKYSIKSYKVPVEYFQLAPHLTVAKIEPDEVVATFSGPRNAYHFLSEKNIRLTLKLLSTEEGTESVSVSKADFNFPKELSLEKIEPHSIRVTLVKK